MSSSYGHFLQGTGTEPSRRTVSEPGRQEHWMHMSLAGPCSPGQMQSFKLEIHHVFETQRWEVESKATGLSFQSRPALTIQVHSRTLGRAANPAHHLHGGRFFNLCSLYTPASTGPAVKEHQLYGKRRIASSLTFPSTSLQLGLCRNHWRSLRPVSPIHLHVPSSSNLE